MSELLGRFIFTLSGDDEKKKGTYGGYATAGRVCFPDQGLGSAQTKPRKSPTQILVNTECYDAYKFELAMSFVRSMPGVLSRGFYVDTDDKRNSARVSEINMIAMDNVDDTRAVGSAVRPFGLVVRDDLPKP